MSEPDDRTRAGERLIKQIEAIGELRNAGPRDQRFKVWRQDTLTLLQRLWPGDHAKAERFRRIPFSAPMAHADRSGAREYFERGCKEAAHYLDALAFELGCGMHGGEMMMFESDGPADEAATDETATMGDADATIPTLESAPQAAEPLPRRTPPAPQSPEADRPISFLDRGAPPSAPPNAPPSPQAAAPPPAAA
ncbi:MAG: hypothetical protein HY076_03745, partial [Candidatus Eisenbacteria bacterium]|nr:hypothetical protein [Candidatus Eisenbacteria bacterium]